MRNMALILIMGMFALSGCRREKATEETMVNDLNTAQKEPLKLEEKARIKQSVNPIEQETVEERKAKLAEETRRRIAELEASPLTEKEAEYLRIKQDAVFRKQAINEDTRKMRETAAAAKAAENELQETTP